MKKILVIIALLLSTQIYSQSTQVDKLLKESGIHNLYEINDDRITKIASKATGGPTSEKYPCFLFIRK